ncbi:sucrose-phosphate phosphatase [Dolichospermum circinale]|uniref:sucrose-phosphate phosphatase n=1 Tax=Dolichospermum circinale TaxID=109265 RepID=UPI000413B385|nr:sucrose-phosphate phosphatase [Dolichospermum circinale]MDB9475039.1 sucrose-phosphate phosphatase [Dolichospermum circinale CS-537/11]MDB9480063.1 sucrose-phosphate phosphatase [Dolichospermum circinale CS-537/03]MDB9484589.1 sucrose-phosphate phosphatase [Dolichospermum circinale CS-537/05]
MAKLLFVTDLDNTLVGDDLTLAKLNQWLSEQRRIYGTVICYTTGRSLALYQQLIAEKDLLEPDILILAVGTEIYYPANKRYDSEWTAKISQGWDREIVVKIGSEFPCLVLQSSLEQTEFKASYYTNTKGLEVTLPRLKAILQNHGLTVQMIDNFGGAFLDILPTLANKAASATFIQKCLGFRDEKTVICGDSSNDLSMFENMLCPAIIVGNAQPELLTWHENYPPTNRYLAKNDFAGGILEGLEYFGFFHDK